MKSARTFFSISGETYPVWMVAAAEGQAGDWLVDRNVALTKPFIEQITTLPNGRYDDQADMMTQASAWLLRRDIPTVTFTTVRL